VEEHREERRWGPGEGTRKNVPSNLQAPTAATTWTAYGRRTQGIQYCTYETSQEVSIVQTPSFVSGPVMKAPDTLPIFASSLSLEHLAKA
jgi:hypothetical protein